MEGLLMLACELLPTAEDPEPDTLMETYEPGAYATVCTQALNFARGCTLSQRQGRAAVVAEDGVGERRNLLYIEIEWPEGKGTL
jgi:hypothetical protein